MRRGRNRLEDQGDVLRKRLLERLAVGEQTKSQLFSYISVFQDMQDQTAVAEMLGVKVDV